MIYYDERHYLTEEIFAQSFGYEFLNALSPGFLFTVTECIEQHIGQLDGDEIARNVFDEDRYSENDYDERMEIVKILNDHVDFDKINALIPKLWYPTEKTFNLTREQLLNHFPF